MNSIQKDDDFDREMEELNNLIDIEEERLVEAGYDVEELNEEYWANHAHIELLDFYRAIK